MPDFGRPLAELNIETICVNIVTTAESVGATSRETIV
jgi:hypothetical protein